MGTTKQDEKAEALENLARYLPEGSTVYCVLRSVAKSGMSRRIDFYTITPNDLDEKPRLKYLSGYIARAFGYTLDKAKEGLRVNGCGMDAGSEVVHNLSWALNKSGYTIRHEWI